VIELIEFYDFLGNAMWKSKGRNNKFEICATHRNQKERELEVKGALRSLEGLSKPSEVARLSFKHGGVLITRAIVNDDDGVKLRSRTYRWGIRIGILLWTIEKSWSSKNSISKNWCSSKQSNAGF